jgi:hypothetical protein
MMGAAAALFALIIACAAPARSEITGEAGVMLRGTDQTQSLLHIGREHNMLPRDASVSFLSLNMPLFHKQGGYFRMLGTNLGEGDVYSAIQFAFNRNLTGQGGYVKTPHVINLASGYHTYRDAENLRLNLYPLGKIRASFAYSNEDKTGRLGTTNFVGQKTRDMSLGVSGKLRNAVVSFGIDDRELKHSTLAHEMDGVSVTVTLNPANTKRFYGQASYAMREFDSSMTNTATNTVEIKNTDLSAMYALRKNVMLMTGLSMKERSSSRTIESLSYDDDAFSFGVRIRSRIGRLGVNYKKSDRDYSGGCVASGGCVSSRGTETFSIKGSSKLSFLGLNAQYEHSNRDVTGGASSTNFSHMAGEFIKQNYSVNLLGFKKFSTVLYNTNNKDNYDRKALYGTSANRVVITGVSTVYMAEPNLDFTLDLSSVETRMTGRQAMEAQQWDYSLGVDADTKYFSLGSRYYFEPGSMLSFGYSTAASGLVDIQGSNQVRERSVSVNLEKNMGAKHSLNAGISRTYFSDQLNSDISGKSTLYEFEILRKF